MTNPDDFVFVDLKTKIVNRLLVEKEYPLKDLTQLAVVMTLSLAETRRDPSKVLAEIRRRWDENLPNLTAQLAAMQTVGGGTDS